MKIVTFKEDLTLGDSNSTFRIEYKKDTRYLVNEDILFSIKKIYLNRIKSEKDYIQKNIPLKKCKKILLNRGGGIGDILFILPYIPQIKKTYPDLIIDFLSFKGSIPVIKFAEKFIDHILIEPMLYDDLVKEYDKIIIFQDFIEKSDRAEKMNAFDLGEYYFDGIKNGEFISNYRWSIPENNKKIKIMIQFSTSTRIRDISPLTWFELIMNLNPNKFIISFLDIEYKLDEVLEAIEQINRRSKIEVNYFTSYDLQETIDIIFNNSTKPHIFIGPDSGLTNIAGYHKIPTIGLYGPFPSDLRMRYYKNAIGIDARSNCPFGKNSNGNCFQHGEDRCKLAIFKQETFSPCLELINYKHIKRAIDHLLKTYYGITIQ